MSSSFSNYYIYLHQKIRGADNVCICVRPFINRTFIIKMLVHLQKIIKYEECLSNNQAKKKDNKQFLSLLQTGLAEHLLLKILLIARTHFKFQFQTLKLNGDCFRHCNNKNRTMKCSVSTCTNTFVRDCIHTKRIEVL